MQHPSVRKSTISRRSLLAVPLLGALPLGAARAQSYPAQTIRFVIPITPGSGTDILTRFIATALAKEWNQPAVIENKPGAAGNIATEYVAKSPGDGYTLLATYSPHYTNPFVAKTNYDPVSDFEPVVRLAKSALLMNVAANSRFKTVADVIAEAKKAPGTITYASSGIGTTSHMCAALLENLAGIRLSHIPYKASSQVATDTIGGVVDLSFNGNGTALPFIQAGRLKALAVTTANRIAQLPDTPTMAESGVPGYDLSSPIWILAPRATPHAVVEKLSGAITRIASTPEFREVCAKLSLEVDVQDAATFRASVPAELEKWRRLVELTGAKGG
jgi:tripartite-type tricarboxylate transporter receptor subunit TctC